LSATLFAAAVAGVLLHALSGSAGADDKSPARAEDKKAAEKLAMSQEQLEEKLVATLTGATLEGKFSVVDKGKAGEDKEDKYTILAVSKLTGGETWIITARVQYGGKDFTVPFPVLVKWAGDTPVITVDDVGVPGGGTYSARVLIHADAYAGTWSGGTVGGLMSGTVRRASR
jgi:hypothetical protein